MKRQQCISGWIILFMLTATGCRPHVERPPVVSTHDSFSPAPEVKVLQEHIAKRQWRDRDSLALAVEQQLAAYPYSKDSLSHATLSLLRARLYDKVYNGDSLLYYLTDAEYFFGRHPAYFRERVLLYSRLSTYYFEELGQQIPTNFYMNKVGIELRLAPEDYFSNSERAKRYRDVATFNRSGQLYEPAVFYIQLSLKYSRLAEEADPSLLLWGYGEAVNIYREMDKMDSAQYYMQLLDAHVSRYPDLVDTADLDLMYLKASYYYGRQSLDMALLYCRKIITVKAQHPEAFAVKELAADYFNIGDVLTRLGRHQEGGRYLQRAADILLPDSTAWMNDLVMLRENRLRNYIRAGNHGMALAELEAYLQKSKEFHNQERLRVMEELETQYRVKEHEKHIDQLNLEKKQVSDELERRNLLLLISVLVILLVAALVIILIVMLRQRRIVAAKEKITLEQQLLRSQMEPHFIFNTLAVLQHMIRRQETDQSIRYLQSFAGLLQRSLENSRESLVSLADEVSALTYYLELQQLRFERKFTYRIVIYKGYEEEELMIPPMLLQPFIENAIEHGFRGIAEGGIIEVHIEKQGPVLECIIEDNGRGLQDPQLREGKRSLSGTITRERLAILGRKTRHPASLTVTDKHTQGRTGLHVRIIIPYQ
ncbi:histidine kinase [Chitinophaga sp. CC14]|uniref:histidine kinase n=1 Tax=Chitinophaga sp. CC14 TaxID=3029199 RepID=UPI003B7DD1BC